MEMTLPGLQSLLDCVQTRAYGTYRLSDGTASVTDLAFQSSSGRLKLEIAGQRATFVGSDEAFGLLAENMRGLLSSWSSGIDQHFHFDPAVDRVLMQADSEAFILAGRAEGPNQ
jgi:hypothetical protein